VPSDPDTGHIRRPRWEPVLRQAGPNLSVHGQNGSDGDVHGHLTRPGGRLGQLAHLQHVRSSEGTRLHGSRKHLLASKCIERTLGLW
jgi:hypothetical protein